MNMRRQIIAALVFFVLSGVSWAGDLTADSSVDAILVALQARGESLKEFSADVHYTETDLTMSDKTERQGTVRYQRDAKAGARMHILFDRKIVDGKTSADMKEYLLNDGWALVRDYRAKNETRYQVAHPGEKVNLFELGKGAFPLPIGQDKNEVQRMFDVSKIAGAADDPPGTAHLQLSPKAGTDFSKKFSTIDVWVDLKSQMPVRVSTVDRNQTAQQQTDLLNLVVNPSPGLGDADFALKPIDDLGWTRHDEPLP